MLRGRKDGACRKCRPTASKKHPRGAPVTLFFHAGAKRVRCALLCVGRAPAPSFGFSPFFLDTASALRVGNARWEVRVR